MIGYQPKGSRNETSPRRSFTAEYKSEADKLAQAIEVLKTAWQPDIDTKALYSWIRQSNGGVLKPIAAAWLKIGQQRIRERERELPIARRECALLKKAAAYFAKEWL